MLEINPNQRPIITADQPAYKIGNYYSKNTKFYVLVLIFIYYNNMQIIKTLFSFSVNFIRWKYPDEYGQFVSFLAPMHIEMEIMSLIGNWLQVFGRFCFSGCRPAFGNAIHIVND